MKKLLLPDLFNVKKEGKNLIKQKLFTSEIFHSSSTEIFNGYHLHRNEDGEVICIVQKGKPCPAGFSRILAVDRKLSPENGYDSSVEPTWLKYPGLNDPFEPEQVHQSWTDTFSYKEENLAEDVYGLRKPQIAAIFSVLSHWRVEEDLGTVVMPTGTGKTETMLSLLIAQKCRRLLIIVPSDPLREQLAEKFVTLGHLQKPAFGIVSSKALKPIVGVLYENFKSSDDLLSFIQKCNVIVTTMDLISAGSTELQVSLSRNVSHIFIDEAHHVKAPTWLHFRGLCQKEKIIQFTATPFRNDGQSLDGKFVFNYSLKKAQEDGYFKRIELIQVNEWDNAKADAVIVEAAINRLKSDLEKYDHILMARCNTQVKANEVFTLYEAYPEYNPVLIHTGLSKQEREEAKRKILRKVSKIIVCVDMLGEGFDLPNLKIAAFHNIRKSLPITVQLAGRFTRTKYDEQLGNASIIVNLKDADVKKELEDFYALGADWNSLLPKVSTTRIKKEIDFRKFLDGFSELDESKIPFQSLTPALSTVVYKNHSNEWFPNNFKEGLPGVEKLDYLFPDINREEKTLVIITGKKQEIDWAYSREIYDILWNLYVIHWDTKNNLLFINASDNAGMYSDLAKAIIGKDAEIINKINIFKAFHGIERVRLQNVGLKEFLGRNISFSMRTGYDIEKALELADKQSAEKAFVYGTGYENGEKVSLGCSYKGRVWARKNGDIQELIEWFHAIGNKLISDVDPEEILRDTLISHSVSMRPRILPFAVDWDEEVFLSPEQRILFEINGVPVEFYNTELQLIEASESGDLIFLLSTPEENIKFKQVLFNNGRHDDFRIERFAGPNEKYLVRIGKRQSTIEDFFYQNPITWWFVDGSSLTGNGYMELKHLMPSFPKENIIKKDWTGVNLRQESQGIDPKKTSSIQFHVIAELKEGDFDIVYDDDYSGEIADVVTVKQFDDYINIQLYHLKFAHAGRISKLVDDLYEVCGQAVKSLNWKFKESQEFFEHLLRRETKKRKGKSCSRIELGSKDKISYFKEIARKGFSVEFEIFIVQPGLSADNPSQEQLSLLAVVNSYLKGKGGITLTVIGS
ncbi:DEAD/DEAH box helicase family protein [Paraflavisolibacter sp. H34]|uniref:DEAD/DEAH box helicase n=1 Tax=Huijunlia imazamoxiresistens TaxID=3127457 RepID=UPI0030170507